MKKAALYPFEKITHGLLRFRDLLEFEIVSVIDFVSPVVGKDAVEEITKEKSGIMITDSMEVGLKDADMLIINSNGCQTFFQESRKAFEENNLGNKWQEIIRYASQKNIEVHIVEEPADAQQIEFLKDFEIHKWRDIKKDDTALLKEEMKNYTLTGRMKKIGIYGTNSCVGKFTTQMTLYRELKKYKKVNAIVTEPTAKYFGVEEFVSFDADNMQMGEHMDAMVKKAEKEGNEYLITAGQSGLSFILNRGGGWSIFNAVRFLSFAPDIVIIVCGYDDNVTLQDTLDYLRIIGGVKKVTAALLSDRNEDKGKIILRSEEEIKLRKKEIKEKFGIETVELIKDAGKIVNKITI